MRTVSVHSHVCFACRVGSGVVYSHVLHRHLTQSDPELVLFLGLAHSPACEGMLPMLPCRAVVSVYVTEVRCMHAIDLPSSCLVCVEPNVAQSILVNPQLYQYYSIRPGPKQQADSCCAQQCRYCGHQMCMLCASVFA